MLGIQAPSFRAGWRIFYRIMGVKLRAMLFMSIAALEAAIERCLIL